MTAILDVALDYISRGWSPVPIPFKSKAPILPGWQNLRITAEEAPRYFNGGRMNGGVITKMWRVAASFLRHIEPEEETQAAEGFVRPVPPLPTASVPLIVASVVLRPTMERRQSASTWPLVPAEVVATRPCRCRGRARRMRCCSSRCRRLRPGGCRSRPLQDRSQRLRCYRLSLSESLRAIRSKASRKSLASRTRRRKPRGSSLRRCPRFGAP